MIGKRLRELRKRNDISQAELGKYLGITTSMVGLYETDSRNPSFDILIKLSKHFCVTTDYLLGITNNESEAVNVPKDYAVIVSDALAKDISPDKLKRLIEFAKEWQGK